MNDLPFHVRRRRVRALWLYERACLAGAVAMTAALVAMNIGVRL